VPEEAMGYVEPANFRRPDFFQPAQNVINIALFGHSPFPTLHKFIIMNNDLKCVEKGLGQCPKSGYRL
jgi:hypothetical protein